ncbi:TIGR02677 family protein [Kineococcus sp. NBC_00420]|uniref:TIGR02677 family protein n=1 Tax=Kineococcus sp. NBC_00420 TaxID=2903564 RepID=UPI002E1ED5E2
MQYQPFAHLGTELTETYRAVLDVFAEARARYVLHLRPEDVLAELTGRDPLDLNRVSTALGRLVDWGNLRADPDTARVETVEDFHRARFLYQLTPEGLAAERALQTYDENLGRRGALQAVALGDIVEHLRALVVLAESGEPDPAQASVLLAVLVTRLESLADNASVFMGSLQRSIDLHDADTDAFLAYKDRIIDYLERFLSDLVTIGAEISGLVARAEDLDVDRLLVAVAEREASDVAPGTEDDSARAAELARLTLLWRQRWCGLHDWFRGTRSSPSQKDLLRRRARSAIPQLLRAVAVLNERRTGRSDRSADFRRLAVWFAEAPDDAARHRLWRAAFGVSPARHLSIDTDSLTARDEQPVPSSTPWAQAPPLQISPQFRRTGHHERRGRIAQVADRSLARRHLAEQADAEVAQLAAARAELLRSGATRLSELPELSTPAFGLFLGLLGQAVTARHADRRSAPVRATSADGSLDIVLTPVAEAGRTTVRTPDGAFTIDDCLLVIVDNDEAPDGAA